MTFNFWASEVLQVPQIYQIRVRQEPAVDQQDKDLQEGTFQL